MTDLEALVRSTLGQRAVDDVPVAPMYELPSAPAMSPRPARRRPWLVLAAGVATVAVVAGVVAALADRDPDAPVGHASTPPTTAAPNPPTPVVGPVLDTPPGQQWISSRGIELLVPEDWTFNDTWCGQTAHDTAVRGPGAFLGDCFTPEPNTKSLVVIGDADAPALEPDGAESLGDVPLVGSELVDGHDAAGADVVLDDGRAARVLVIEELDVSVVVRAVDADLADEVIRSVRVVDQYDGVGCPVDLATAAERLRELPSAALPERSAVESVTLCTSSRGGRTRLDGSVLLTDAPYVDRVHAALTGGRPVIGPLPDLGCPSTGSAQIVVALRMVGGDSWVGVGPVPCAGMVDWLVTGQDGRTIQSSDLRATVVRLLWGGVPDALDAIDRRGPAGP